MPGDGCKVVRGKSREPSLEIEKTGIRLRLCKELPPLFSHGRRGITNRQGRPCSNRQGVHIVDYMGIDALEILNNVSAEAERRSWR